METNCSVTAVSYTHLVNIQYLPFLSLLNLLVTGHLTTSVNYIQAHLFSNYPDIQLAVCCYQNLHHSHILISIYEIGRPEQGS